MRTVKFTAARWMPGLWMLGVAAALLTLAACGGNGSGDSGGTKSVSQPASREDVLTSLTTLVIVPRYQQAADAMGQLADSVQTLCSEPNAAALESARIDWRGARNAWVTTEAFRFGPAMDRRSQSLVDWWPVSVERIDRALSGGDLVTEEAVRQFMPATQRGIGAMERLLFGKGSNSLATQGGAVRCGYLRALTSVAHEEIGGILHDWEGDEESPGYAGFFDGSANSSLHPRVAEAEVGRSLVFLVRTIANMRLGAALGVDAEPDLTAIPSGAAGHSSDDLSHQLLGISEMYRGADSDPHALGIGHMVSQLSPEVDSRMTAAIESASTAIDGVDGSLESAIAANPQSVRNVYDSFKELQRVLNTEVVSVLGVTVGFSDTDGDS